MSSIILELKESYEGTKKDLSLPDGVFDSEFTPQLINEGDIIQIKSGFLDTVESSNGTIKIDETNNSLSISYVLMIQNWVDNGKVYNGVNPTNLPAHSPIDNLPYIACKSSNAAAGSYITCDKIRFYVNPARDAAKFGYDYHVLFEYTDIHGNTNQKLPLVIPTSDTLDGDRAVPVNTIMLLGSLKLITSTKNLKKNAKVTKWNIESTAYVPVGNHAVPSQQTFNFTIDNGTYEYAHLAKILTDKLTDINNRDHSFETPNPASNNAFLMDNAQIRVLMNDTTVGGPYYTSTLGTSIIQLPETQLYPASGGGLVPTFDSGPYTQYIGASQVAFVYDEDLQKFTINQMHSTQYSLGSEIDGSNPVQYNQDGVPIVRAVNNRVDGGGTDFSWTGRGGCIAFTSLEPAEFWFKGGLGLNPNCLITLEPAVTNDAIGNIGGISTFRVQGGLINGQHTTDAFIGSDSALNKNQFFNRALNKNGLVVATNTNTVIYGNQELNAPTDDVGYLQVSIDGWKSNLYNYGDKYRQDIKAVVSRFYSSAGYTSFYSEGNTSPYIHLGKSIYLSKLRVRVLKPDGEEASEIVNADNTVFIEIIKPSKNTIDTQIN